MTDKQDPIAHAARLLREAAEELRQAHTLSSDRNNWIGEPEAKAAYDEHMAAAQALEDWEAAIGAGGVQPLRSILEGCKVVPLEPTPEMLAALMSPGEAEVLASSPSETFALMLMDRAGIRERYSAMLGAAPQQEAQEPVAYVHVPHFTVEGKVRPVVSFEKYQQDYADGIYSTRIPLYTAPKAAPGEQDDHQILAITTAYEQGVGKGHQAYNSGKEIANPYSPAYRCDLAWQYGYKEGKEQAQREAKAAPQQEAQEPIGWTTGIAWRPNTRLQSEQVVKITRDTQPKYGYTIPIYTAPQPAPAPLSDDVPQKTWALLDELEKMRGANRDEEDWDTLNKRDDELRAALAAQGGK